MIGRKEKADIIKASISRYYTKKKRAVSFEVGVCKGGRLRADVFVVAMSSHVVIVEVKSSVADFRTDTKWRQYQPYCNQFYFAFSSATWKKLKDEVPKDVGVFVVTQKEDKLGRTYYVPKVVRKARNHELDINTKLNLAIRCVFRHADATRLKKRRINK